MTTQGRALTAQRTVTGVVAGMVAATAAATLVGFWLSYDGLHEFALRAALHGPEAWAWPASVDLFILAGEAGVTISALRRRQDRAAWCYLALGFAASVTANVLHVDPSALHWTRYAVAAVPPVAAMLALAALLRQVYRLAETGHVTSRAAARDRVPASRQERSPAAARGRSRARSLTGPATPQDAEREFMPELAAGAIPSIRQIRARAHVGHPRAVELREHLRRVAAGARETAAETT